jgi:hypothetical protein
MNDSCLRRAHAAARFRPDHVKVLLVAEAPPREEGRYFYFTDVAQHDDLFRFVVRTVLGCEPSRTDKARQLGELQARGVFVIDLKLEPKGDRENLAPYVNDLVARAVALTPDHVITIKANVCTLCAEPLRNAGLDVSVERVPFPGSGQQRRFTEAMTRALSRINWR